MLHRVGLAILALLVLWSAGCAADRGLGLERFEFTRAEMGMPFRIVVYAPSETKARAGADRAFNRVAALNGVMSDYEDDSELSRLSHTAGTGQWVEVSADLWAVLARGQAMARASDGAFDVTVGPYVRLWRRARRQRELPEDFRMVEARSAVGYRFLEMDAGRRQVRLVRPGMRLDLGGIAKGHALQEACADLERSGLPRALVTGGGDMVAGDAPPGRPGWRIEVASLDVTNAPPSRWVWLKREALATSGDLFQRLELDGRRYSHIVDPRTGIGLTNHCLATVIARDGMTADALSTAVSVLGPKQGLNLVKTQGRGGSALVVQQAGDGVQTVGNGKFKVRTSEYKGK
jgi:thiamine biosynthesis lipoprotein